jgi:hypothetical protein
MNEIKTKKETSKSDIIKSLWISIDASEMMRESMKSFIKFLNDSQVKYRTFSVGNDKIYMELLLPHKDIMVNGAMVDKNPEFNKEMGEWVYYNPINVLRKKPNMSHYDILEDMSIEPHDNRGRT